MHPASVLVPALVLILGPRLWVNYVLKKHDRADEDVSTTAGELARLLLDGHGLQKVRVEKTDIGDHYDPSTRTVRIARDKFDRKTLTALTTASHEVAHAIQHATDYGPFLWRTRLVKVAQVAGDVGTVLLLAVPVAALTKSTPLPPGAIAIAALAMLGTSGVAQLASLPSELDASFARALPMLKEGHIASSRQKDARSILTACSLTYVVSSMVAILHVWPWLGRVPVFIPRPTAPVSPIPVNRLASMPVVASSRPSKNAGMRQGTARKQTGVGFIESVVRQIGKPLVRSWLRVTSTA